MASVRWKSVLGLAGICLILVASFEPEKVADDAHPEACDPRTGDCAVRGDALLQHAKHMDLGRVATQNLSEDSELSAELEERTGPAPSTKPSGSLDATAWTKRHNYWRCIHGSPPIVWDEDFAADAQKWALIGRCRVNQLRARVADRGVFEHGDCYNIKPPFGPAGENLAAGSMGYMSIKKAVDTWHDEEPEKGPRCGGHCTAMLWKAATKLGCGINPSSSRGLLLVCRYGGGTPLPNMAGSYEANVGFPDMSKEPECKRIHMDGDSGSSPALMSLPPGGSPLAPSPPGRSPLGGTPPSYKALRAQLDLITKEVLDTNKTLNEVVDKIRRG